MPRKGYKQTEEHRRNVSKSKKGCIPWNKDKKCPQISKRMKNRIVTERTKRKTSKSVKQFYINNPKLKEIQSKRCKQNWQNGVYDGVFVSPNKPEKKIMKMLEDLKFDDYIFQYRPKGYSKVYDFYVFRLNLLIEYDGIYWHNRPGAKEKDAEKTQWAIDNGYNLLRINKYNVNILKNILKGFE